MNKTFRGRLQAAYSLLWVQILTGFLVIAFIVLFDQITKHLAFIHLSGRTTSLVVIPHVINFRYLTNSGAAWGMLSDQRWIYMSISIAAILAILYLLFRLRKSRDPLLKTALLFFVGGGIGNMIDRIANGYVIDFLEFGFMDFPVFNVADSFVTIAAALMIVYLIKGLIADYKKKKSLQESQESKEASSGDKKNE